MIVLKGYGCTLRNEAPSRWVEVPAGGEAPSITIRLVRAPMLHLSGRVISVRGAPPPARVELLLGDGSLATELRLPADGTFTFWRLMPGRYRLVAYSGGEPADRRIASVGVEITEQSVDGIELSLVP